MEDTPKKDTTKFQQPQRRFKADVMSSSYNAAFVETTPFKSLASSSRQASHQSYHTLPRKRNSIPSSSTITMPLAALSLSHSSMASIHTATTDDYTFTSDVNPNYTNMMNDNQLIDSCTQAQSDILRDRHFYNGWGESSISPGSLLPVCNRLKRSKPPSIHCSTNIMSLKDTVFNAQKLQQWIAYMQRYVEAVSPSRSEVLRMTSFERKTRLGEQVDLRKYIASYDATVKRFVRSATCAKGGIQIKHLEESYLLLLLQAIDAQCLLEGYPGMRNGPHCGETTMRSNGEDDPDIGGIPAEPLVARFVEGQSSSSPAITYNYYCLNKSPLEDKGSEYSYDSVDGTNLRDEILNVIGLSKDAEPGISHKPDDVPTAESSKDLLTVPNVVQQPSSWTKKNVNRWLHFQPIAHSVPINHEQVLDNGCVQKMDNPPPVADSPKSACHSPRSSEMSFDPDQHWDGYQEIYSTDGSSHIDLSTAEELLHFGDNYSDLLRKSEIDHDGSSAAPSELSSSISSSVSPIFHDESNANAQLDDSFLLSGYTKSLELSALKSIDEIFDFKELHSNAGSYGAIEWIDPSRSPRRSPSGTSCSQSTLSTSSRQRDESTLATSNYFSALDTGQEDDHLDTSRSMSMESLLDDMNDRTLMPTANSPDSPKTPVSRPTIPVAAQPKKADPILPAKRTIHKARRRKTVAHSPPKTPSTDRSNESTPDLVVPNIKEMQPADVHHLLDTCKSHLGCLNHVLLGQTVNCIVAHPAMNIHRCEVTKEKGQICRCGTIARFVQSMIDFLLDITNSFRHFRLYQLIVRTIRQLYGMVQTISAGVRRHRMEMNSIEFVL